MEIGGKVVQINCCTHAAFYFLVWFSLYKSFMKLINDNVIYSAQFWNQKNRYFQNIRAHEEKLIFLFFTEQKLERWTVKALA